MWCFDFAAVATSAVTVLLDIPWNQPDNTHILPKGHQIMIYVHLPLSLRSWDGCPWNATPWISKLEVKAKQMVEWWNHFQGAFMYFSFTTSMWKVAWDSFIPRSADKASDEDMPPLRPAWARVIRHGFDYMLCQGEIFHDFILLKIGNIQMQTVYKCKLSLMRRSFGPGRYRKVKVNSEPLAF